MLFALCFLFASVLLVVLSWFTRFTQRGPPPSKGAKGWEAWVVHDQWSKLLLLLLWMSET